MYQILIYIKYGLRSVLIYTNLSPNSQNTMVSYYLSPKLHPTADQKRTSKMAKLFDQWKFCWVYSLWENISNVWFRQGLYKSNDLYDTTCFMELWLSKTFEKPIEVNIEKTQISDFSQKSTYWKLVTRKYWAFIVDRSMLFTGVYGSSSTNYCSMVSSVLVPNLILYYFMLSVNENLKNTLKSLIELCG